MKFQDLRVIVMRRKHLPPLKENFVDIVLTLIGSEILLNQDDPKNKEDLK